MKSKIMNGDELLNWLSDRIFSLYNNIDHYRIDWYTPKGNDAMSDEDKKRLICIFDDRNKVVNMWRSLGITCLQVANGDF